MASEFLKLKCARMFNTHDLNKDNVVTIEDADVLSSALAEGHNMAPEKAKIVKEKARIYWQEWILGDHDKLDEATFVANKEKEYLADPKKFEEKARRLFRFVLEILDNNNDFMISEHEFEIMAKSTGFKNYDKKYMQAYPQIKPGYISLEEYLECFVEFNCNPDKDKIRREKPRLYGMGVIDDI